MNFPINRKIDTLTLGLTSFLCSLYVFQENLKIELGPIDDHEIVRFLGSDGRLWLWQIPRVLIEKTEVGEFGEYARFRPVYYTLRMIETSTFGVDSTSWYFARIVMVSLVILFLILGLLSLLVLTDRIFSLVFGLWFALSIVSLTAWQDIVSRLGPAEIYLALEISIFFYLASTLATRDFSFILWLQISLIYVAIAGTKENGLTLLFPYLLLFVLSFRRCTKQRIPIFITFSSSVTLSGIIAAGWILGSIKNAGDIYGGDRSLSTTVAQLSNYGSGMIRSREILFAVVVTIGYFLFCKLTNKALNRSFFFTVFAQLSLVVIKAGEHIFYQGEFATLRYAVVGQLFSVISFALTFVLLINLIWLLNYSPRLKKRLIISTLTIVIVFISIPSAISAKSNFSSVAAQSEASSAAFQTQLEQIRIELSKKNYSGIVIQISNVWDYEPAYAFSQYLEFYGNGLPKYLNVTEFSVAPGLESKLLNQMKDIEKSGNSTWLIQPNSQMEDDSLNYCVTLNRAPLDKVTCSN